MKYLNKNRVLIACALLLTSFVSQAALISLVPNSAGSETDVIAGDLITFEVKYDFSNEPALGGGFDIAFDSTAFNLISFINSNAGDPSFSSDPSESPGFLSGWAAGDFNGLTLGSFGFVTLEVLSGLTSSSDVTVMENNNLLPGPFVSAVTFQRYNTGDIEFRGFTVTAASTVPQASAPAMAGLFMLGLAGMMIRRRKA